MLLVACGDGATDARDASPTASPAGGGTGSDSPAPTSAPVIAGPCCLGFELDPGRYAAPSWFEIPFSIEVGEGLSGWESRTEEALVVGRGDNDVSHLDAYLSFFVVGADSSILRALGRTDGLSAGSIEAVEIAGIEAEALDARARPTTGVDDPEIQPGSIRIPPIDDLVPGFWYSESAEARFRFLLLPIGEVALFVSIEAPPAQADSFIEEAVAMLETMTFD
jgi:hypothetical protein